MDFHLLCIVLIFLILFILEKIDGRKNNEGFSVVKPGYTNTSPFLDLRYNPISYSVNLSHKDKNFGNFGTIGSYPVNPLCNSCNLEGDVVTAPYLHANNLGDESGDLYGKVGRNCNSGISGKNYDNLNKPFLVAGRSAGRIRQCKRLL
jgi:hypothetical protein